MMRWLSIGVISYMIAGITWWGLLLYQKNEALYQLEISNAGPNQKVAIEKEYSKQRLMIISEGLILGASLLAGIYIIYRSGKREIQNVQHQNNFVLSVSHELKSPIAAIKLAFETLNRKNLPEEKAIQIRNSGIQDSDRLEQLVQNLLLSASIEEKRLELYREDVDLNLFITNIISSFNKKYAGLINLRSDQTSTQVEVDKNAMERAISNVIQNATKYANPGTEIVVSISRSQNDIHVNVTNQGPSISVKEKHLIFDRFYRSKDEQIRKKEGTGIGLYVSREILKAHNGTIILDNSIPNKTTFSIRIPLNG